MNEDTYEQMATIKKLKKELADKDDQMMTLDLENQGNLGNLLDREDLVTKLENKCHEVEAELRESKKMFEEKNEEMRVMQ